MMKYNSWTQIASWNNFIIEIVPGIGEMFSPVKICFFLVVSKDSAKNSASYASRQEATWSHTISSTFCKPDDCVHYESEIFFISNGMEVSGQDLVMWAAIAVRWIRWQIVIGRHGFLLVVFMKHSEICGEFYQPVFIGTLIISSLYH